jgi:hypothetical protein
MIRFLKILFAAALFVVLLVCSSLVLLQTSAGREWVRDAITKGLHEAGIEFDAQEIEGALPLKWTLKGVKLKSGNTEFTADEVKLRVALFPLLTREIELSYLALANSRLEVFPSVQAHGEQGEVEMPITFGIRSFSAPDFTFVKGEKAIQVALEGSGRVRRSLKRIVCDVKVSPKNFPHSFVQFSLSGTEAINHLVARIKIHADSTTCFEPFFTPPYLGSLSLQAHLEGPWTTWRILAEGGQDVAGSPLKGNFRGAVQIAEIEQHPWLKRSWELGAACEISPNFDLTMKEVRAESDLLALRGKWSLKREKGLESAALLCKIHELAGFDLDVDLKGSLEARIRFGDGKLRARCTSKNLLFENQRYEDFSATLTAKQDGIVWNGRAELAAREGILPFQAYAEGTLEPLKRIFIHEALVTAPETRLTFSGEWDIPHDKVTGVGFGQVSDMRVFRRLAHDQNLRGSAAIEASLRDQTLKLHIAAHNTAFQTFKGEEAVIDAEIYKWKEGKLTLDAKKVHLSPLFLSNVQLTLNSGNGKWPFQLKARGMWEDALELIASGAYEPADQGATLRFDNCSGFLLKKPFGIEKPFTVEWSQDIFNLNDCDIRFAEGSMRANIALTNQSAHAHLKAEHFPLELLLVAHPSLTLRGTATAEMELKAENGDLQGNGSLVLEHADVAQLGKSNPLMAKGVIQANLSRDTLQLHAHLKATSDQFLELAATLPIKVSLLPFELQLEETLPLSAQLTASGKLEEIFDFVNIGNHHISGHIDTHLFLSRTAADPALLGEIELLDGAYENYVTGTNLEKIKGKLIAEGREVKIDELTATDGKDGSLIAKGVVEMDPEKKFPFSLAAELDDLRAIRFDLISSSLSGKLELFGSTEGATGKGKLQVTKAEINIPDDIPVDIPSLPVTFVNPVVAQEEMPKDPFNLFPFHLDLEITAPDSKPGKINVRGKGLRSEWQGALHLAGTQTEIAANGSLTLLRGEYVFAGKVFKLTNGEILFSDKPTQNARITINGTLELPDVLITALLSGPLESPMLTFQSTPHMPTSSIVSRILFNKDISEISPMQAVQLAQTIVTLSGGAAPDVLEAIRRSLGVDRLNIVSSATTDEVTVQIGKYLAKGVMVTLVQGTDYSRIIVELELDKGFVFQAETEEEQEGKFTIKWNRNY